MIATNAFFTNSGQRFWTDTIIQNTNNMEDRLSVRKKAFVAITSVSLKMELESRKWQPLPATDAPVVAES